jgi:hypothetical protein
MLDVLVHVGDANKAAQRCVRRRVRHAGAVRIRKPAAAHHRRQPQPRKQLGSRGAPSLATQTRCGRWRGRAGIKRRCWAATRRSRSRCNVARVLHQPSKSVWRPIRCPLQRNQHHATSTFSVPREQIFRVVDLTSSLDLQVEDWLQFLDADGGSMTDAKLQKVAVIYAQAFVILLLEVVESSDCSARGFIRQVSILVR